MRVLYWFAVLVVSVALVLILLLWLESRDQSSLRATASYPGGAGSSVANTTIRRAAL